MKNLTVISYRANENEILSIYVMSNESFSEEEAFDAIIDSEYCDMFVDFIEFDSSVAEFNGFEYCAIFHENTEN